MTKSTLLDCEADKQRLDSMPPPLLHALSRNLNNPPSTTLKSDTTQVAPLLSYQDQLQEQMATAPTQQEVYPTPPTSQTPVSSGKCDICDYLREGLEGVEHLSYGSSASFTRAIESQAEKLRLGNAGQYVQ
ncbi:hypothetical protein L873DRAFT_1824138 [Choiromyces venosus 120613-1]|uniref:Uncharacterized protein n=1 Tax=Choiromyces venosus 120613-1 TaxID=1336337 RepID=A0A3N4IRB7_9PEZI|nr:hypothetical protein L873DRAFT_1824138 [Choiromyces venosus 120613-1]